MIDESKGNVVATYKYSNGTTYIMDTYLPKTDEENDRRWQEVSRVAHGLLKQIAEAKRGTQC